MNEFIIAPSILSADFAKLGLEIEAVTDAGADWIHVDVMDGHFVPNLTLGPPVVKAVKPTTNVPLDVHLMIEQPEKYIEDFAKAGADYLTVHIESTSDMQGLIAQIKSLNVKPGITLRPGTALSEILPFVHLVDLVLVMTVEPGFGGQSFMEDQVAKMDELKKIREEKGLQFLIEVDGGVNATTVHKCQSADVLVAGSFVFKGESVAEYRQSINTLKGAKRD